VLKERGEAYLGEQIRGVYSELFELSAEEVGWLLEGLHSWNVLRQCCGLQLSRTFAEQLKQEREQGKAGGTEERHRCFTMAAEHAEEQYMQSKLFAACPGLRSTSTFDLAVAGEMEGHYCLRTQRLFSHGAAFNGANVDNLMEMLRMPWADFDQHNRAAQCCSTTNRPPIHPDAKRVWQPGMVVRAWEGPQRPVGDSA
jgi:hypothetical protein